MYAEKLLQKARFMMLPGDVVSQTTKPFTTKVVAAGQSYLRPVRDLLVMAVVHKLLVRFIALGSSVSDNY